jgi:hypothetical protein
VLGYTYGRLVVGHSNNGHRHFAPVAIANSIGQPQGKIYSWLIVKKEQQ